MNKLIEIDNSFIWFIDKDFEKELKELLGYLSDKEKEYYTIFTSEEVFEKLHNRSMSSFIETINGHEVYRLISLPYTVDFFKLKR